MRKSIKSTCLVFALVAGCATSSTGSRPSNSAPLNPNEITQRQLDEFPSDDAYAIIERLHPMWLMNTATSSFGGTNPSNAIQVYWGTSEMWLGGTDVLHNYMATELALIYHLNKVYANNPNGAIVLIGR